MLLVAVAVPFLPGLAAAFAAVTWEGAVGGAAYANAFANVAEEVGGERKRVGLAVGPAP